MNTRNFAVASAPEWERRLRGILTGRYGLNLDCAGQLCRWSRKRYCPA